MPSTVLKKKGETGYALNKLLPQTFTDLKQVEAKVEVEKKSLLYLYLYLLQFVYSVLICG